MWFNLRLTLTTPIKRFLSNRVDADIGQLRSELSNRDGRAEAKLDMILQRLDCSSETRSASVNVTQSAYRVNTLIRPQVSSSTVLVSTQYTSFEACVASCACLCHLRSRSWWRSPELLHQIIGLFFLHYTGFPNLRPTCDLRECKTRARNCSKFTYCLPRWFVAKAFHAMLHVDTFGDPSCLILVQRRTSEFQEQTSLYHLAQHGYVSAIKETLSLHRATPNDAADLTGATALHVCKLRLLLALVLTEIFPSSLLAI